MVPDEQTDGRRQNYITPTSLGDKKKTMIPDQTAPKDRVPLEIQKHNSMINNVNSMTI